MSRLQRRATTLGALALVGVLTACGALESPSASPGATPTPRATLTIAPVPTPIPNMGAVQQALRSPDQVDIVIFSDSTADEPTEWPALWADAMADDHAVTLHRWINSSKRYQPKKLSTTGPIRQVWNCSVSGWRASHFFNRVEQCMPEPPELVIVSLGHNNNSAPHQVIDQLEILIGRIRYVSPTEVPVVITLQNPVTTRERQPAADQINKDERAWATEHGYPIIDVEGAFKESDQGVAALLKEDGLHPSEAGSVVWVETVIKTLTPEGA